MSLSVERPRHWVPTAFTIAGCFTSRESPQAGVIAILNLVPGAVHSSGGVRGAGLVEHVALGPITEGDPEQAEILLGEFDTSMRWEPQWVRFYTFEEHAHEIVRDIQGTIRELDGASPWTVLDRTYEQVWGGADVFVRGVRLPNFSKRYQTRPFMMSISVLPAGAGRARAVAWVRSKCAHRTDPLRALCGYHRIALGKPFSHTGRGLNAEAESLYALKLAAFLFGDDSVAQEVAHSTALFRELGWLPEEVEGILDNML